MKVLIVGYGSIGKRHASNLKSIPGIEVLIVTNQNVYLHDKKCRVYRTIDSALQEKPTAAIISNVSSLHVKTALKLSKANVHLLVEKPLSNNLNGVKTLVRIVKKKKLVTLIGCNFRFHPCLQQVKKIISNHKIGKIISVDSENGSYLPSWHQNEDYRKSYAARKELGGGALLTNIHEIDYLFWLFGKIKQVFSITGKFSDLQVNTDDLSISLLQFTNNIVCSLRLNYFQNPSSRGFKIIGTKGTIQCDLIKNSLSIYANNNKKWINVVNLPKYDYNKMYVDEIKYFLNCVKNKKATFNPIESGAEILEIALSIQRSSHHNRLIKLVEKTKFHK